MLPGVPMPGEPNASTTVLLVSLKTEGEQMGQIASLLDQLGIPAGDPILESRTQPPGCIAVRVPTDRLVEVLLALEYHGFKRVRGYPDDDHASGLYHPRAPDPWQPG